MTPEDVARLLPIRFGAVREVRPIHRGLSGASVHEVVTDTGAYVLRIGASADAATLTRELAVRRVTAEAGIAPSLEWADDATGATLTRRIGGPGFSAAMGDPAARPRALGNLAATIGALHALPPDGFTDTDAAEFGRRMWRWQQERPGFPEWAHAAGNHLERGEQLLAADRRRVPSHNDMNPANVLWDGERVWLVDWEQSGLNHPYYDMASLSTFLTIDEGTALQLLGVQEGGPVADPDTFRVLRRLTMVLYGATFLGLSPELAGIVPPTLDEAPTLSQCYAMLTTDPGSLRDGSWQTRFGAALLRRAITGE